MEASPLKIHVCCFIPEKCEYDVDSLQEFSKELQANYPEIPRFTLCNSSNSDRARMEEYLLQEFEFYTNPHHPRNTDLVIGKNVFVACDPKSSMAEAIRVATDDKDSWRGAVPGLLGAAILNDDTDKYLIWHEAFHILNAKDCYRGKGIVKDECDQEKCLMRYVPIITKCGPGLVICQNAIGSIFKW